MSSWPFKLSLLVLDMSLNLSIRDCIGTVRGSWPSNPKRMALSVPWPLPVRAREPKSSALILDILFSLKKLFF